MPSFTRSPCGRRAHRRLAASCLFAGDEGFGIGVGPQAIDAVEHRHHLSAGLGDEACRSKPMTWSAAYAHPTFPSSASAATRLARIKRIAWAVDAAFRIPGTRFRFGLNSVLGLTPAAGDALLAAVSLYIVSEARKLGLPREKITRMLTNVGIETVAGAVPILGDLFDMGFKANLRNIAIIEEHLTEVERYRSRL